MIKITNEVNGKKYELERYWHYGYFPCESCDLRETCGEMANNQWEGFRVCDVLPGVWKEVRDAD
jgi:hypothetical protein